MIEPAKTRAALLAGLAVAVLGGASPSHANVVAWGAIKAPADIIATEPAKKAKKEKKTKKEKPAKRKPADARPTAAKPRQITSGEPGTVVVTVTASRPAEVSAPQVNTSEVQAKTTKDKKTAKSERADPVVPPGPLHVIVSVDAQRASLYANGAFVASTQVSTGTKSHPTPMGVFSVIQKNRHHVSNLYGASMPYMQRLTWSGTAMHTGPLPGYPASHGCIRLTNDFARLLWKATKIGARVIVTRDEVKPVEFAHDRLFAPRPLTASLPPAPDKPAETTGTLVRTADAANSMSGAVTQAAARSAKASESIAAPIMIETPAAPGARDTERRISPVSIFISRKDGKLYARQAMQPLFDLPLTLRNPEQPVGTHVFTAMEIKDGAMRWTAVSVPSTFPREIAKTGQAGKKKAARAETTGAVIADPAPPPNAGAVLDRIDLPQYALDRLAGMITPGSSLIVSDNALSTETGSYTDFIVLTR